MPSLDRRFEELDTTQQQAIAEARNTTVDVLRATLEKDLHRIASRAVARQPEHRYPSVTAMIADLDRYLEGQQVDSWSASLPSPEDHHPSQHLLHRKSTYLLGAICFVLLIAVGLWMFLRTKESVPDAPMMRSLAVLPLKDLASTKDGEFFADAMTEELIVTLGRLRDLHVIAPASVMAFKESNLSRGEIAEQLRVDAFLEGSVVRAGPQVRITMRLIQPPDGTLLWSQSYERSVEDVLAIQRDVAQAVAAEIHLQLTPAEEQLLAAPAPMNPQAYEAYLRGRHFWNRRTEADLHRAIEHFLEAIRKFPDNAMAYAGIADSYVLLVPYGTLTPKEAYPSAKAAALRAIEFDPALGGAYASLALVQHEYEWDWKGAEENYRRALELSSNDVKIYQWYAEMLTRQGRYEEALTQIRRAQQIDPMSPIVNSIAGWVLYHARQYPQAVRVLQKVLQLDPDFIPAHRYLGMSLLALGDVQQSLVHFEKVNRLSSGNARSRSELGIAYVYAGQRVQAQQLLRELLKMGEETPVSPFHLARLRIALGEPQQALNDLEAAFAERGVWMLFLKADPLLDPLRGEPRFQELMRRVGFPM